MEWYELTLVVFGTLLAFLAIGVPVAFAMGMAASLCATIFLGPHLLLQIGRIGFDVATNHLFLVAPLFVMMAALVSHSDIAEKAFVAATKWFNWVPGALPVSTVAASTAFAAISGSSPATAAAIGYMAVPEMIRHGYSKRLAVGVVAAGGTLGILIPPSVVMVIYGIMTETSIGSLFIAGIIPGLLLTACFMGWIYLSNVRSASRVREVPVPMAEKLRTLSYMVPPFVVFGIVMGSLYFGIATATESAALGVIVALFFVWQMGKLNWEVLRTCFIATARVSGMILLIIMAAFILNLTISLTGVADAMTRWVTGLGLSATGLILALVVFYLVLGMFMDVLSMQVATIPITFPIATAIGVDPIWFGIFIVLMCEMGMITPPVGMNLFVVHGIRPDKGGIEDAIWGALPYAVIMILFTLLMMAWPSMVTWLPGKMA